MIYHAVTFDLIKRRIMISRLRRREYEINMYHIFLLFRKLANKTEYKQLEN